MTTAVLKSRLHLPLRASNPTFLSSPKSPFKCRHVSTLPGNPHVYVFPDPRSLTRHILTLLPTTPPTPSLAIGTTTALPPTPDSLVENPRFLSLLHSVLRQHAHSDPGATAQAQAFASNAGSTLGSGGLSFPPRGQRRQQQQQQQQQQRQQDSQRRTGGASGQGGAGGGGRGGHIHVSDERKIPDFGRIADPEDIFGSLEVDSHGRFVDGGGNYQESGTYRVLTREGCLGLSSYLRGKVVERLKEEEITESRA